IAEQFQKATGFSLKFAEDADTSSAQNTEDVGRFHAASDAEPMEINQAIAVAKQYGKEHDVTIYKAGVKNVNGETRMEVHFISPEVAERYRDMLQNVSKTTGMSVQYAKQPKQNEILRITKESIPPAWGVKGNPSIHMDIGSVSVKLTGEP